MIRSSADTEIEVSRSRFLCRLRRVESEAAARDVVEAARRAHWDARHHCTALVIGPGADLHRSSDDGEPSGTAGMPMLDALRGAGVSDVVAVVTRYFGGVLLGTGGLARAYGAAVRAGLDTAGSRERRLVQLLTASVPLADVGRLEFDLRSVPGGLVRVRRVEYGEPAVLLLSTAPDSVGEVEALLARLCNGRAVVASTGQEWVDAP